MSFRELQKSQSLPDIEQEVLEFWDSDDTFRRSMDERPEAPRFVFFEGPPTANGHPGTHHVLARTVKDTICRAVTRR